MTKRIILSLVALLALAACASPPASDWCYRFDFKASNYGISLPSGNWTSGQGFTPDSSGDFQLAYSGGATVTPAAVVLGATRIDGNQIPIAVSAQADVFGISSGFISTTVPQDVPSVSVTLLPGGGSGSGMDFAIQGNISHIAALQTLDIYGNGSNPFPANNCGDYSTPAPSGLFPTPIAVPNDQILNGFSQSDQQLGGVSSNLQAPDGSPLLPADTSATVFGYIKWITSPATADELMGPFSPVYSHVGIFLILDVTLVGVYVVVYVAVYIARWFIRLFKLIMQIAETVASAAGGVISWLLAFVGL